MTAGLNAGMTADPVTDPEGVIIADPEMVPEMKDLGKEELGNLAEGEVLGVTAKSKESNNGRQMTVDPGVVMTVDPEGVMIVDPEGVMTVDPGVAMTVDPEGAMVVMIVDPEGVMTVDPGGVMIVDPEGVMT